MYYLRNIMKLSKILLTTILLFILQINSVFANEVEDTWYFYKVSKKTVSGEFDFDREILIENYADTKIRLTNNKIILGKFCNFKYKKNTIPLLSYWKSTETTNLYKKFFLEQGVSLGKNINVIIPLDSDNSCPSDLSDFIKTNDYLISLTKKGYLILFSKKPENRELSSHYIGLTQKLNFLGNSILSDKKIVHNINKECDFPADGTYGVNYYKCDLTGLEVYFGRIKESMNQEKTDIYQRDNFKFFFTNKQIKEFNNEMYLNIEKNNKLIDQLTIYKQEIFESYADVQYYYIDNNVNNIWLLNYTGDTDTHYVEKWRHYKVDNTGHFKLSESISCKYRDKKGIVKCKND